MNKIKLFENFDEGYDKEKADEALESMMSSIFPDHKFVAHTYQDPVEGEYIMDEDADGDGTKYSFVSVYLSQSEFDAIEDRLENDYEGYVKELSEAAETEIYDVGSAPEDKMISISIAYKHSFRR